MHYATVAQRRTPVNVSSEFCSKLSNQEKSRRSFAGFFAAVEIACVDSDVAFEDLVDLWVVWVVCDVVGDVVFDVVCGVLCGFDGSVRQSQLLKKSPDSVTFDVEGLDERVLVFVLGMAAMACSAYCSLSLATHDFLMYFISTKILSSSIELLLTGWMSEDVWFFIQ